MATSNLFFIASGCLLAGWMDDGIFTIQPINSWEINLNRVKANFRGQWEIMRYGVDKRGNRSLDTFTPRDPIPSMYYVNYIIQIWNLILFKNSICKIEFLDTFLTFLSNWKGLFLLKKIIKFSHQLLIFILKSGFRTKNYRRNKSQRLKFIGRKLLLLSYELLI